MEINTILNILSKNNLTADELLVIYLTFLAQDEEGHPEYFRKWFENGGNKQLREIFESLKSKGIIHKDYNPSEYNPNDIEFNKIFLKSWIKNSNELGMELFDAYPKYLYINGKLAPLRNISKKYDSLEDFCFAYASAIKHNPDKHNEIMKLLKWGIEHNKINFGLTEFVVSHKWEDLEYLKNNPQEGEIETTFNVYESI